MKISAPGFILSVIRIGYKISFIDLLPPKVTPNNSSALKEREFVSEAIFDLLKNKCVEVLDRPPTIENPLSVSVQSSGKKRLILNLRHFDMYILNQKLSVKTFQWHLKLFLKILICLSSTLSLVITTKKFSQITENF